MDPTLLFRPRLKKGHLKKIILPDSENREGVLGEYLQTCLKNYLPALRLLGRYTHKRIKNRQLAGKCDELD